MITAFERRAISAAYRVATSKDEAQFRALARLQSLTSEQIAWDVWLSTKPDPELVQRVMDHRLKALMRAYSPLYRVMPQKERFKVPVKVHHRLEV